MRRAPLLSVVVALAAAPLLAEDLKSGPQVGDRVGAFTVEKCGGNPTDGVKDGESLCYRCKLGNRPVVAVFSRTSDKKLANLMQALDEEVQKNTDQKMASFVNLLGEDPEALKSSASKLVEKAQTENVAVVVPAEHKNGPEKLKLNPDAEVTVVIYTQGKVKASHALAGAELNQERIAAIIADTKKILN